MNVIQSKLASVKCRLYGHDWRKIPHLYDGSNPNVKVGECARCGKDARFIEAIAEQVYGNGPPYELVEQTGIDELKAAYREGNISQDELELLLEVELGALE